jgi:hypothetical protein
MKYYVQLQSFTDAFRDCKVDCKLILPYLDAVGEMLLHVGAFIGHCVKLALMCFSITSSICNFMVFWTKLCQL